MCKLFTNCSHLTECGLLNTTTDSKLPERYQALDRKVSCTKLLKCVIPSQLSLSAILNIALNDSYICVVFLGLTLMVLHTLYKII